MQKLFLASLQRWANAKNGWEPCAKYSYRQKSGTTLVQTSVGYANNADEMLFALFKSACEI
jgi:hypothetical protein